MAEQAASAAHPRPLAGCRVLDLSLLLPGPYCSWMLACFGAEVTKVEPPEGDPLRRMNPTVFGLYHRGKQALVLDLKTEAGRAELLARVAEADVLIEGFRPGTLARLGLPLERLMAARPPLVVASISGYGWSGPLRDRPGHDIGFLAQAGYFAVPSELDAQPTRPQVRLADLTAGQSAAFAVVMAWLQARSTGQGSHVDAAIFDATVNWTAPMMLGTPATDDPAQLPHVMADSALYRTADGRHLCIATLEDKFWQAFAAALPDWAPELSDPRWATRHGRDSHKRELAFALSQAVARQPLAAWLQRLADVDTTVTPVHLGREALDDAQTRARALVVDAAADGLPELYFPALFNGQRHASLASAPTPCAAAHA